MVAGKVEECRRGWGEAVRDAFELKGTCFDGQEIKIVFPADFKDGVAEGVADVAGGLRPQTVCAEEGCREFCRCGFPVGSGDRDIAAGEGAAGEFEFADHLRSGVARGLGHWRVNGNSGGNDCCFRGGKSGLLRPVEHGVAVPFTDFFVDGNRVHSEVAGEPCGGASADTETENQNIFLHCCLFEN